MLKEAVKDALDRPQLFLNDPATAGVARAFARSRTRLREPENMKSPDRIASVIAFDGRLLSASQMFLPCIDSSVQCTRKMPNLVSHSAV